MTSRPYNFKKILEETAANVEAQERLLGFKRSKTVEVPTEQWQKSIERRLAALEAK